MSQPLPPIWHYRTRFGAFEIRLREEDGRFILRIYEAEDDFEILGSYHSAAAAADDVYMCATGFGPWDSQGSVQQPTDLSEWQRGHARFDTD